MSKNSFSFISKPINSTTNVDSADSDTKTLKSFYKHIYDTRPAWYVENKMVNIDIIASVITNQAIDGLGIFSESLVTLFTPDLI